ncbi:MAG: hypothetical protein EAY65_06285 [Alphaproteobacteria bacterium]|nr:MAG: hypothetical protein EAY65_06285 [Alphaproteobacteria bacterium]
MDSQELFREVNDAMRQEQWQKIFGVFGKYIIVIIAIIIFITVGYVLTRANTEQGYEHETLKLYHAIEMVQQGQSDEAREAFVHLSQSDDDAIGMMAYMWRVKLEAQAGRDAEAATLAREARKKFHLQLYKPYYDWFGLYLPRAETSSDVSFQATQAERDALVQFEQGGVEKMLDAYRQILKDDRAPSGVRERAAFILQAYGADVKDKDALKSSIEKGTP